jgi:hypothetical protein
MRGEKDRECRAHGGHVPKHAGHHAHMHPDGVHHARGGHANAVHKNVIEEFHGAHPDNAPDDALKRGGSIHHAKHRLHRARGGKSEYTEEKHDPEEKRGGRVHRKRGGHIDGEAKKPHMGRAMRKRGGRAGGGGADLHPVTHDAGVEPKGRHIMNESEKTP